ncbi:tryptophan--tRNA ligase [archaeon SCG-AAA382B04]|nr:tryptophan--tRNA ligase [archaeon SCG-AAA382B04]
MKIDPWSSEKIDDYNKLVDEFGLSKIDKLLNKFPNPHNYHKRGIIFGHRDYEQILDSIKQNKRYVALSGFVPSGDPHLGHKMVMDQLIWHQRNGGEVFASIADMEALGARDISLKEGREIGKSYFLSLIALGLEEEDSYFYYQSREYDLRDLSFELSENVNIGKLNSIYGFDEEKNLGHLYSTIVQSGDILYPQLEKFGGPCPIVVPAGTDQDPHIRLVRDLASSMRRFRVEEDENKLLIRSKRANEDEIEGLKQKILKNNEKVEAKIFAEHLEVTGSNKETLKEIIRDFEVNRGGYGFYQPSSTYHRFMSGLKGGKMSSSVEGSYISLTEEPESAKNKVMKAKTGGRTSIEEQKQEGGKPKDCAVYELLYFHLIDEEDHIQEIHSSCKKGERLCGECKKEAAELLENFLINHQEKREKAKQKLEQYLE